MRMAEGGGTGLPSGRVDAVRRPRATRPRVKGAGRRPETAAAGAVPPRPGAMPLGHSEAKGGVGRMLEPETVAAHRPRPAGRASEIVAGLLRTMRPQQWTKNVFVFAGLVFGRVFLHPLGVLWALWAFAVFCLLSSAVYCLNDYVDRDRDRLHPRKRLRAIASGLVPPALGLALAVALALIGLAGAAALAPSFFVIALAYLALNVAYSFGLKHVPLWDALTVAGGFVLRALAGTTALHVAASPWLLVCTYLVALYLSLGKRWSDAVNLAPEERAYRRAALVYEPGLVRLFMQVVMATTLMSYALYAVEGPHSPWMLVTLPFVIYGLFHYQHMVESRALGGAPESAIFQDRAFLVNAGAFAATALCVLLASGTR